MSSLLPALPLTGRAHRPLLASRKVPRRSSATSRAPPAALAGPCLQARGSAPQAAPVPALHAQVRACPAWYHKWMSAGSGPVPVMGDCGGEHLKVPGRQDTSAQGVVGTCGRRCAACAARGAGGAGSAVPVPMRCTGSAKIARCPHCAHVCWPALLLPHAAYKGRPHLTPRPDAPSLPGGCWAPSPACSLPQADAEDWGQRRAADLAGSQGEVVSLHGWLGTVVPCAAERQQRERKQPPTSSCWKSPASSCRELKDEAADSGAKERVGKVGRGHQGQEQRSQPAG